MIKMNEDNLDIEDTTDLINQDALTLQVLNAIIPIKYLTSTSTRPDGTKYYEFIEENTNLKNFMPSFTGFANVPSGTSDLRGMFNDLNGLLVEELKRKNPNKVTLSSTTKTNCNNKGWRTERSKIHSRYNNMCFYCGKTCKKKLQCDHVIPIMQMYISLERDDNLFYNFERVHSQCNSTASNMTLNEIWQKIGTSTFQGPRDENFVSFNIKKQDGTLIKDYKVNSVDRQAICRGYLAYNILSKLTFSSLDTQRIRALLMKDVINKYLEFKTLAGKLLSEQGIVAQSLIDFSRPTKRPRPSNFGIPTNVVNKTLYEEVKKQIKSGIKGRRWGAYDSGRLVQMYQQLGGKYSGTKKETPLERWYKEKWVNACKWPQVVPCGRSDMSKKMAYCRPSVKVTKDTPKTVQSLTQAQINKRCTIKEKAPWIRIK